MKKDNNNKNKSIHDFDLNLICELHVGLERQGLGSPEMTIKALSFLDNLNKISRVADLGCGTGELKYRKAVIESQFSDNELDH